VSSAALEISVSVAAHFRWDVKERERASLARVLCRAWNEMSHRDGYPEAALVLSVRLTFVHPLAGPSGGSRCPKRGAVYQHVASEKILGAAPCP